MVLVGTEEDRLCSPNKRGWGNSEKKLNKRDIGLHLHPIILQMRKGVMQWQSGQDNAEPGQMECREKTNKRFNSKSVTTLNTVH